MSKNYLIVAFGGVSPEHEVSVLTGMQALSALEDSAYQTVPLYISKSGLWYTGDLLRDLENYENLNKLTAEAAQCTFTHNKNGTPVLKTLSHSFFSRPEEYPIYAVLTAFHGSAGENGSFQGVCETFNIPYTGSNVLASSVGMDKTMSKKVCKTEGIPVVEGIDFLESDWIDNRAAILEQIEQLGKSAIVKPVHLGSSIGVEIIKNRQEAIKAIETAFRYDAHLVVEKTITPLTEVNCSVMGTFEDCRASVCERPLGREELLSFTDKYQNEENGKGMASASRVIPADIDEQLTGSIQQTAISVFKTLQASGLARLDFLVNSDTNEFFFNEINTIPGSFSFYLWKESDVDFTSLLDELIQIAVTQHQNKNGRVQSYETNLLSQKAVKGMKGLKDSK